MSIKAGRFFTAALVLSLLIQMQIAVNSYASRKTKIAFTSTRDGNAEIYVMDGDGRNHKRLTVNPTMDRYPTWSPDGKKIAFVSNRNKGYIQIWVIDADGGNPIRLTDGVWDRNPDWSPDGRKIAYDFLLNPLDHDRWNRTIYVMDSNGKNNRRLIEKPGWDTNPSWSPDGEKIAFASYRDIPIEIYVMDAFGRDIERITYDFTPKYKPTWSPDGSRIAYYTNHHIGVMDSNGENQKRLTKNGLHQHPTWSPDSGSIAFHSWDKNRGVFTIVTVGAEGGAVNPIGQVQHHDFDPDWLYPGELSVSPAGSRITIWGRLKNAASNLR